MADKIIVTDSEAVSVSAIEDGYCDGAILCFKNNKVVGSIVYRCGDDEWIFINNIDLAKCPNSRTLEGLLHNIKDSIDKAILR